MADAQVSKTCECKLMRVRLSPAAPLVRGDSNTMWVRPPLAHHFCVNFFISCIVLPFYARAFFNR